ncbi:uncharacterized protein TEOVI_000014200 [Trypanosoma equiperdum]|uniref:Trypanosome variant surface glycoprotein (A-type) n=1 Tax=Trypanosoma equiperdum TaxID=5694 RepID=A0A1G4I0G1_TRYEQ|nr:hypothetical protein, conserved [Trypanosoma equiperdum]
MFMALSLRETSIKAWILSSLLLLLLRVAFSAIRAEDTPGFDAAGTKAPTSCDEIRYLLGIAHKMQTEADQNVKIPKEMQTVASSLALAALIATDPNRRAAFQAMSVRQRQLARAAQNQVPSTNPKLYKATVATTARAFQTIVIRKLKISTIAPGPAAQSKNGGGIAQGFPAESTIYTKNTAVTSHLHDRVNCNIDDLNGDTKIKLADI